MKGGFYLIQHVDLRQHGQQIKGIEIIGHLRPYGEEASKEIGSRYYDSMGNTQDYVYEVEGDTLTIWAGEKGSPAYYKGTFSEDGNTLMGAWVYRDGSGYESTATRVSSPDPAMPSNRSMPESVVIPELAYRDVAEAVAWLCKAFGFEERLRIGNHRAQLTFGPGSVIVTQQYLEDEAGPAEATLPGPLTHSVMVRVNDIDRHYERAVQSGVRIIHAPADYPYGERQYSAEDPGGHLWTFSQTIADVDPTTWGGKAAKRT